MITPLLLPYLQYPNQRVFDWILGDDKKKKRKREKKKRKKAAKLQKQIDKEIRRRVALEMQMWKEEQRKLKE